MNRYQARIYWSLFDGDSREDIGFAVISENTSGNISFKIAFGKLPKVFNGISERNMREILRLAVTSKFIAYMQDKNYSILWNEETGIGISFIQI